MASTSAKWRKRSNLRVAQSVKQRVPSQIGIWCGADVVERGAIRGKRRKSSIERGVIFDRGDCEVWGLATRDDINPGLSQFGILLTALSDKRG
jgi:hypothetical protein